MMIAGHVSFHLDFLKIKSHDRQTGGGGEMTVRDVKLAMVMKDEMKEWKCLLMFNQLIAETREHIRSKTSQSDV